MSALPPLPSLDVPVAALRNGKRTPGQRTVPEEAAIAFVYDGASEAVMMATPQDLEDFAYGFSATEGIIETAGDIRSLSVGPSELGVELRMELAEGARDRVAGRRRTRAGPAGCGLCGIESLAQAMRTVPRTASASRIRARDVVDGMRLLTERQWLNDRTHAVHAAGFYLPETQTMLVREDVGRHNALDKAAGGLMREGRAADGGLLLLTSRISVELVQKAAMMGVPVVAAISAPTALALRVADEAGIAVAAVVRGQEMEVFTHQENIR